jgi:hypothetical protein
MGGTGNPVLAQQAQRARATLARHDVHALLAPVAQELAAAADAAAAGN